MSQGSIQNLPLVVRFVSHRVHHPRTVTALKKWRIKTAIIISKRAGDYPDFVFRDEQGQGRVRGSDANVFYFNLAAKLWRSLGFPQIPPSSVYGRQGWRQPGESEMQ